MPVVLEGLAIAGAAVVGIVTGQAVGSKIKEARENEAEQAKQNLKDNAQAAAPAPAPQKSEKDKTAHGEQRAKEGRNGDPNRNVGDTNKIKNEGNHYHDNDTGNEVYVKGDKVYIENENGQEVSQFHNSKANTQSRIDSGRWEPVEN